MVEPNINETSGILRPLTAPIAFGQQHASETSPAATQQPPSKVEETFVFPASREQTRYWMLAQLDPASTASNMAIAFDLTGEVNVQAAEAAIAALTMRHEALRTLFRLESGELSQVIVSRSLYSFSTEDLSVLPEAERAASAEAVVSRHGHTVINLHSGPVLHVRLIHLDRQRHILALTMNHIVCDGWSNGILIRDFTQLYERIVAGKSASLPELPFQFADFALWQQEYLQSQDAEKAAEFWKSRVTPDLPALDLPTDYPRAAGRSFPGHIESALLPKAVDEKLKEYCRISGSTKHIVLLAAFQALCARYTGQSEFLLGSTIANRTQPGMENVVGRFANPQIIVAKTGGDPTFAALEERVREWGTEAYNHQDLPFSRIIEDFQINQAGATSQFLQVWFLYQKAFMQPQAGATISVTPRRSVSGGVDFDLLVSIVERAEGPRIQMEYNIELFEPQRIRGFIEIFSTLLEDALANPTKPISLLAQRSGVTGHFAAKNLLASNRESGDQLCILERVRQAAATMPESIAATDEAGKLTWAQLESISSSLAQELKKRGARSEAMIAIPLTQTAASLTALLGALKSGARVLPLPAHSSARSVENLLQGLPKCTLLAPAEFSSTKANDSILFEQFAGLSPAKSFEPEQEATVLFLTDAATPAWESFTLRQVTALLEVLFEPLGVQSGGGEGQESLLAFPASAPAEACLDRLMALASWSQLNFAQDTQADAHAYQQRMAEHQVTRILISPQQLRKLVSAGWSGDRRTSLVLRGGRLPAGSNQNEEHRLPRYFKAAVYLLCEPRLGGYVAWEALSQKSGTSGMLAVRGNLSVRDDHGRPLPGGAFGTLFVDDTSLHYMARSRSDSTMEAIDREDRFVHLRGHRVCLGDIDEALRGFITVSDCFSAISDAQGEVLTSYMVASSNGAWKEQASPKEYLAATLPSHMVPSEYVWVDQLSISLAGNVEVSVLPAAPSATVAGPEAPQAELTQVEEKLAAIWKDVLGLRHVDIHIPFFQLGGSSLLLVRLFARINKAFNTSLPITAIFDAKTIAELALTLGGEAHISPMVHVQTDGSKPPLFMIHSYLLYKGLSTSLGNNQPFYGLRELDRDGHLTIEERVARYVTEIRQIQAYGPYHLAGWCAAGPLTVEVARQLMQAGEEVNYIALLDSWLPGYLESIESEQENRGWRPIRVVSSKLAFHRRKMSGLNAQKKLRYTWLALTRIAKETRYHIYLKNWERLRRLSEKYQFALPQFMHNTSLDTFSALKDYREKRLPARLTLIRATDSREVRGAAASCGWERVAEQGVDVLWAPGDHETMFIGANLDATANILAEGLENARQHRGPGFSVTSENADSMHRKGAPLHVDCPIH